MSELESQIAQWRRDMRASGIRASETLDELEDHLRSDIERRTRLGAEAQRAFETATANMGKPAALQQQFQNANLYDPMKKTYARRTLAIIALVAVALSLLLPALHHMKDSGVIPVTHLAISFVITVATVLAVVFVWKARAKA